MKKEKQDKFLEKECPLCGKTFIPPRMELWVYKTGSVYLCSWKCLQKWRGDRAARFDYAQLGKGQRKDTPEIRAILKMLQNGKSVDDIARRMGVSRQLVNYYRRTRLGSEGDNDD